LVIFWTAKIGKYIFYPNHFSPNRLFWYIALMFTGIIEANGLITRAGYSGTNRVFWVESPISHELNIDQSLSHDGVCLTVDALEPSQHRVTAIAETLHKTSLGHWNIGNKINLERCLQMNGRIDGHIVQGHVDCTGQLISMEDQQGSWLLTIAYPRTFAPLLIEKGSICMNGISLTVFNAGIDRFQVAIIPYTYQFTNIGNLMVGDSLNLEFDLLGKYIQRNISLKQ
jgi:riboflavin synthase